MFAKWLTVGPKLKLKLKKIKAKFSRDKLPKGVIVSGKEVAIDDMMLKELDDKINTLY